MRQAEGREELCIDSASAWPQLATAERWGAAMLRGVPWKSTKEEAACWAKLRWALQVAEPHFRHAGGAFE